MSNMPVFPVTAIILAAGQGTRMKSPLPKVLHTLCGRSMLEHVLDATFEAGVEDAIVVVGHGREQVERVLAARAATGAHDRRIRTAIQTEQRGTADAVKAAYPLVDGARKHVLILCGDTPLLRAEVLRDLIEQARVQPGAVTLLTTTVGDPSGYGRILRDNTGNVVGIREQKDCSADERRINEINPGVYCAERGFLGRALERIEPNNAQKEYYLTDIVPLALQEASAAGHVHAVPCDDAISLGGINDRVQLAEAEDQLYGRIRAKHQRNGVTVRASARIDASVRLEADVTIEHGVVLRGSTTVGAGTRIDVGSVLTNVSVGSGAEIKPYTVATDATIGDAAQVGPFSHLRPESVLGEATHVGNFVEIKKVTMHKGAKANHLAYLGDGEVGAGANVGAGTIFCNYDGFQKHRTVIGAGAFIGSDSQLVAPVTIGDGAYVGTGTTVTQDVPAGGLALSRVQQINKEGYAEKLKAKLLAAKQAAKQAAKPT